MPAGAMKQWEHSGEDYNRAPRGEVAWVRIGTTAPAMLRKSKVAGEVWFMGSLAAWKKMDWMVFGQYAQSDTGIIPGKVIG